MDQIKSSNMVVTRSGLDTAPPLSAYVSKGPVYKFAEQHYGSHMKLRNLVDYFNNEWTGLGVFSYSI